MVLQSQIVIGAHHDHLFSVHSNCVPANLLNRHEIGIHPHGYSLIRSCELVTFIENAHSSLLLKTSPLFKKFPLSLIQHFKHEAQV